VASMQTCDRRALGSIDLQGAEIIAAHSRRS